MLADYLIEKGFELVIDGSDLLVKSDRTLTSEQMRFLSIHKLEIIKELAAANDERKFRFCYRWVLSNGDKGTLISSSPPERARIEVQDRFLGRDLVTFDLLN
ncbi:MAG: hypothetical protein QM504_15355 [Pseudomonadota bacterium]